MVRPYSNENFPFPVVQELRLLGHDITTVQETGLAGQAIADEAVLAFACQENRALITLDELQKNLHEVIEILLEDGEPRLAIEFIGTPTVMV